MPFIWGWPPSNGRRSIHIRAPDPIAPRRPEAHRPDQGDLRNASCDSTAQAGRLEDRRGARRGAGHPRRPSGRLGVLPHHADDEALPDVRRQRQLQPRPRGRLRERRVGIEHPWFRFFVRRSSGPWGNLAVRLRWKDSTGHTNETTVGTVDATSWQPTGLFQLSSSLPLWQSGQTLSVQIVFDPENYGGAYAIDDVYIDPYTRG
jgi:hypothetical protein